MTTKDVKLGLVWGVRQYEVKTITNSTQFKPGDWLDVEQVQQLCDLPNWEIIIADNATFQAVIGFATSHVVVPL